MPYSLSNLILLLPVACSLAIIMGMTGSQVVRARSDFMRTGMRIMIWLFLLLAMTGLLFRVTALHSLWVLGALAFGIHAYFWERSLARNMILLAVASQGDQSAAMARIAHYLKSEGTGYWKRLGTRFGRALQSTGDWRMALVAARLARGPRARLALAGYTGGQGVAKLRQQIVLSIEDQQHVSAWLGRLVVASLSYIPLLFVGSLYAYGYGSVYKLFEELSGQPFNRWLTLWFSLSSWHLHIWLPLLVWGGLLALYLAKLWPWLLQRRPLVWLAHDYYRALSLQGLADMLQRQPLLSIALQETARAMPVRVWAKRLDAAANGIAAGNDAADALRRRRLLSPNEQRAVALCHDPASLALALEEISQAARHRLIQRTNVTVQVTVLVLISLSAALTCLIATATFTTLTGWIEGLAN